MSTEQDVVYLYPKTSCPCADCSKKYKIPTGPKTNLSVRGCEVSPYFGCFNRVELSNSEQPREKKGYEIINPQAYTDKQDPSFYPVKCPTNNGCTDSNCPNPSWISADPRLFSVHFSNYIPLDRPPMNGDVRLKNLMDPKLNCYGNGFTPYDQIRDGQITYYTDKSIEDPFFSPVFGQKAKVSKVLYKDPMGGMRMQYEREATINTANPTTTLPSDGYDTCLSFLQDSQSHREDLMSYQMRKTNETRWEPAWS